MFAVSNGSSSYGTSNLSNNTLLPSTTGFYDRSINFTQPMNFFFIYTPSTLYALKVVSAPLAATTDFVALTTPLFNNLSKTPGTIEVALNFSTIFPSGFPSGAKVQLYSSIFGGGTGPYVGPTIPSGQSYGVTYKTPNLIAHDSNSSTSGNNYLIENTFYTLSLDPNNLGLAESGITPSYVEGQTFHTVTFTGNPSADFSPTEKAMMNTNTMYGPSNLLNSSYITWNETTLFLGVNGTESNNWIYLYLSNDTNSGYGAYNITVVGSPFSSIARNVFFSKPVNFIIAVGFNSAGTPYTALAYKVVSTTVQSNTSVALMNITTVVNLVTSKKGFEVSMPFQLLYNFTFAWPVFVPYSSLSMIAAVTGGSGASTGPTLPAGQGYAYTGYYNKNHTFGNYLLLNTFFTIVLDPYGDGVPALQINPTYWNGHTYHSVKFTGNVLNDFSPLELVGTNTLTPWGPNTLSRLYFTWNFTELFFGVNATVLSGNNLLVAISNGTYAGTTNLSKSNTAALQRNITFSQYVNFIFTMAGGAATGSLYEVIPSQTNTTQTNFTLVGTFPAASDGAEFNLSFSTMYPNQPSVAGSFAVPIGAQVSVVAAIYGGSGPWVGPTIPSGQTYTGTGSTFEHITSFITRGIDPNKNGYANPDIAPGVVSIVYSGNPINLNIVFNDHQPLYSAMGQNYWMLGWTAVHLAEYAEQALIIHDYPGVNITYSLSGSLLYQIAAIAHGNYNNSYIMAAFIPVSQWNNTLYQEITQYGDTFLMSFVASSQWNTTTVFQTLEYNLAFNTPPWVYTAGTPAANTYAALFSLEASHVTLTTPQLVNALVEFFLWSASFPIASGMLGSQYINSTMYNLYNQTSFKITDITTITHYYAYEANLTVSAFRADMMLNSNKGGNVELLTTPFDHPIQPLLLLNNWTGATGDQVTKGVWSTDEQAQLNIGLGIFNQTFSQMPLGLWSPEQAVSGAIVPYLNQSGIEWTSSADSTLAEAGYSIPSSSAPLASQMESLYQPYNVWQNNTSVVMVFRDSTLSNAWGFNYGTMASSQGNWAPVGAMMTYLKNIYATVPRSDHSSITVTVALDGENWMFMSPFPTDGVPFLQDLYLGLQQNSSWLHTTTMQQYIAAHKSLPNMGMPNITNLPIGSWNPEPTGNGISQYLGQWAGHAPQDATWEQLALVRSMVLTYGQQHGLQQLMTLAEMEQVNSYPFLGSWNLSTPQLKYYRAWMDIYGAEASDITFTFDPANQNLNSQNAVVFEFIFRQELSDALKILGLPLTPFLEKNWTAPVSPTTYGTNSSITPPLSGSLYYSTSFSGGIGYSVNNNFAWKGAAVYNAGGASGAQGINKIYYAFDANNLYFAVSVNGPTGQYVAPNSYTPAPLDFQIYLSTVNPGVGNLAGLSMPNSVFATANGEALGYPAQYMVTIQGASVAPSGQGNIIIYSSGPGSNWVFSDSLPNANLGSIIEIAVPLRNLGMIPGNSITFSVATVNATTGSTSLAGPLYLTVPSSLAKFTLVSVMHNTYPDNGPGNYTYPTLAAAYKPGSVDMQWVNVSMNSFLVQFNITFGSLYLYPPFGGTYGFSIPMVDIYVHTANGTAGNTAMLAGPDANVSSDFAWQWAIQACGYAANSYIQSYQGTQYTSSLLISSNLSSRTVSIEVPLSLIGDNILHYGYVIAAGFQDGYGTNGWKIVYPVNSTYQGGGSGSPYSPNIYSYIAPAVVNKSSTQTQQSILSTYTKTAVATLPGIYLPLVSPASKGPAPVKPTYSSVGFDSSLSEYLAFYDMNKTIYWSSSSDGSIWSDPSVLFTTGSPVNGMSYASTASGTYLLVSTGSGYTVVTVGSTLSFHNVTLSGVVASAVASQSSEYIVFIATSSGISAYSSSGSSLGSLSAGVTNMSAYFDGTNTYIAYTSGSSLTVVQAKVTSTAVAFSQLFVYNASSGSTIGQISMAVNKFSQFVVAYVITNSSGSNILLTYGVKGNLTTYLVTSDGLDTSPSALFTVSGNTTQVMVGFTNGANQGNVYYIPKAVTTFTYSSVTVTPKKTTPVPVIAYVLIGVGVIVVVGGVAAYTYMSRKRK